MGLYSSGGGTSASASTGTSSRVVVGVSSK